MILCSKPGGSGWDISSSHGCITRLAIRGATTADIWDCSGAEMVEIFDEIREGWAGNTVVACYVLVMILSLKSLAGGGETRVYRGF